MSDVMQIVQLLSDKIKLLSVINFSAPWLLWEPWLNCLLLSSGPRPHVFSVLSGTAARPLRWMLHSITIGRSFSAPCDVSGISQWRPSCNAKKLRPSLVASSKWTVPPCHAVLSWPLDCFRGVVSLVTPRGRNFPRNSGYHRSNCISVQVVAHPLPAAWFDSGTDNLSRLTWVLEVSMSPDIWSFVPELLDPDWAIRCSGCFAKFRL